MKTSTIFLLDETTFEIKLGPLKVNDILEFSSGLKVIVTEVCEETGKMKLKEVK